MKRSWKTEKRMIFILFFFLAVMKTEPVAAESLSVTFGSESYETSLEKEFPIGVYIDGEAAFEEYEIEISYDKNRMEYLGGADEKVMDGLLLLSGTGGRESLKYRLRFKAISGGEAYIEVLSATVQNANEEAFDLAEAGTAPIQISGEDTVGNEEEASENETETEKEFKTEIPILGDILLEETKFYIIDMAQYLPMEANWEFEQETGSYEEIEVTFLTDIDREVKFLFLLNEQEEIFLYAYSDDKKTLFPCNTIKTDGEKYYFMSPYVCRVWPEELTLDIIRNESVVYAMDSSGVCDFYKITASNKLILWDASEGEASIYKQTTKLLIILGIALFIMAVAIGFALYLERSKSEKLGYRKLSSKTKKNKFSENVKERVMVDLDFIEDLSLDVTPEEISAWRYEAEEAEGKGVPVIAVKNVTMKFKIATSNVSGIKEYVIQLLKKQISYRELLALNNVSFNAYKGEVVGIIGTNGSGKSTLLKIVSGALKPTGGKVEVDRNKVQLLTLGTGFDMELTAKENVYLNGAIIGYTKEFIDERYDEIVAFAELEGFMEEKVKNFSSGMVSRLGFAIATAGDAAEILILDEVLSVGDEFFRKKSLKRVKEMIHGGSTVLIVSHSTSTIIENCTKAVWIEKGVMKMMGEPKKVCEAYQKMNDNCG